MTCPTCNRILASTLSVCPSCGTLVHDTIREDLALKISPSIKQSSPFVPVPPKKHQTTSQIMTKTTSATLVDFQNKNTNIPEWRLQIQNAVRKRLDGLKTDEPVQEPVMRRATLVTNGATALQVEAEEQIEPAIHVNPQVAAALQRIEQSRQKYLIDEAPLPPVQEISGQSTSVRQFPQIISNYSEGTLPYQEFTDNTDAFSNNVVLFSEDVIAKGAVTNKLPPLPPPAKISSSFEKREEPTPKVRKIDIDDVELDYIEATIHKTNSPDVVAYIEAEDIEETDGMEDFAPLSMRFNAALFDLLICSFMSLILLAPFMLVNGKFFSMEGFFGFLVTCSIVMFIYLTTSIGFLGRTFGMRLFSLEIIDVEENAYPTLHQAAVSSSVYLLSLALGGIGFLAMLLNSERRAAHDLLSGTIVVREY